jgi:serralysin
VQRRTCAGRLHRHAGRKPWRTSSRFRSSPPGQRLDPDRINGVEQARLTIGADGDAVVTFRDEVAEFQNTLGVYLIEPDGTIRDPEIVFPRIEHADPLPGFPGERPGGGPLAPGDDVALSDLYPAADLQPGQEFGLFVVADGADLNPGFVFDRSGELEFVNTTAGGPANIADDAAAIELRHVADDGTVRTVAGPAFHTADDDPDRLENNLNPGGAERVVSGADPASGALLLGFEDAGDFDFDDVVLDLGAPGVVPPPIVTPTRLAR